MKVLITGASGFVASRLIKKIQNSKKHKVFASSSTIKSKNVIYWKANMSPKKFAKSLNGIDMVIHLASYIPQNHKDEVEANKCIAVNSIGTLNLLNSCKLANIKRFVFISSVNIFAPDNKKNKITRSSLIDCKHSPYYLGSKILAEIYVKSLSSKKISTLIIRPSSIYGKNMKNGVVQDINKKLLNKQKIILKNNGKHQADFLYIDDCVSVIEKLSFSKVSGEINVGSGTATNIYNLTKNIAKIHSIKNKKITLLTSDNRDFKGFYPVDLSHLRSVIRFKPTKIMDGLSKMFYKKKNQK
jgi:nucleoside-diphosphate-sugar epimerase